MRNLKRALSLAMATFMLLGMMVVGAGAAGSYDDLSDKDKIVNQDAVSVLTTLDVIQGRDDGSFDPEGVVTRAEMAKMICKVLNGGRDPQLGNITANFTDAKGHWAESYIAYCANLGIIAGYGDGTFLPNATVSAAEAAKMLLTALGYNAGVEGYVGAQWQINVDVAANQLNLYKGVGSLNTSEGLSRDNAAQIIYNALDCKMVEYNYVITGTADNSITTKPQTNSKDKGTLLEEKFGAIKVEGIVIANEYADMTSTKTNKDNDTKDGIIGAAMDADKSKLIITNTDDQDEFSGTETFTVATGADQIGRLVSLYVKPASTAQKSTVIGAPIVNPDNKVITDYSSDSVKTVADDNDLGLADNAKIAYNYAGQTALTETLAKDKTATGVKTGVEKILIDANDDGDVDYVLVNTWQLGKVAATSTKDDGSIRVDLATGSFKMDNSKKIVGFDDVAKDDFVLTAFIGGRLYVDVAETVTGEIEAFKLNNEDAKNTTLITVDGTDYKTSFVPTYTETDLYAAIDETERTMIGSKATFFLDKQGYVIARGDVIETAYDYALLWGGAGKTNVVDDTRVKVTLSDGTTKIYDLHSDSQVTIAQLGSGGSEIGTVWAYSLNKAGDTIKLTTPKGGTVEADTPTFTKGKSTIGFANATVADVATGSKIDSNSTALYGNNSTVFFYVTMANDSSNNPAVDKVSVYAGRDAAPTVDGATTNNDVYLGLNRNEDVGAVAFTGVATKDSAGTHLFVYGNNRAFSDYVEAKVFLNGSTEPETVKVTEIDGVSVDRNTVIDDGLYTYSIDKDGYYELDIPGRADGYYAEGKVTRTSGKTIVLDGSGDLNGDHEFTITKDTVVIDNTENPGTPDATTGGGVSRNDNVALLENSDGEVLMVVIDNPEEEIIVSAEMEATVNKDDAKVRLFNPEAKGAIDQRAAASQALIDAGFTIVKYDTTGASGETIATVTVSDKYGETDFTVVKGYQVSYNGEIVEGVFAKDDSVKFTATTALINLIVGEVAAAAVETADANGAVDYTVNETVADDEGVIALVDAHEISLGSGVTAVTKVENTTVDGTDKFVAWGTEMTLSATGDTAKTFQWSADNSTWKNISEKAPDTNAFTVDTTPESVKDYYQYDTAVVAP